MKKRFVKWIAAVAAGLITLPLLPFAVSCSVTPRSEAEVIPDAMGKSEGLWLYKGNRRSRTDGTEAETLLSTVTVGETAYGEDEFKVVSYAYARETSNIFYIIQIGEDCRLARYDYQTKLSSDLYDLPDVENPRDYKIEISDSLAYVNMKNDETSFGVIFSNAAQLLYEDFCGTLDGNIVYRFSGEYAFEYYFGGEKHEITLDKNRSRNELQKSGNYFYLFSSSPACAAIVIDLEAEKTSYLSLFDTTADKYRSYKDFYRLNGSLFVLTNTYDNDKDKDERLYQFIRITGTSAEVAYDFGDVSYGVTMSVDGDLIYLLQGSGRDYLKKYYAYDSVTGSIKRVGKRTFEKGKSTETLKNEAEARQKELSINGYTFYVISIGYDDQPGLIGTHYTKTCYYLMRRCVGAEEIMQYNLNKNDGYFFDDIREF